MGQDTASSGFPALRRHNRWELLGCVTAILGSQEAPAQLPGTMTTQWPAAGCPQDHGADPPPSSLAVLVRQPRAIPRVITGRRQACRSLCCLPAHPTVPCVCSPHPGSGLEAGGLFPARAQHMSDLCSGPVQPPSSLCGAPPAQGSVSGVSNAAGSAPGPGAGSAVAWDSGSPSPPALVRLPLWQQGSARSPRDRDCCVKMG